MTNYVVPTININSIKRNVLCTITEVPGSKSITNRALLLASLSNGTTHLSNVLFSDDSRHFLKCIQNLGVKVEIDEEGKNVTVYGTGKTLPTSADIYVGSAGTAARFLSATLGVSKGTYTLNSSEQMKRRPMLPLIEALESVGCKVSYLEEVGHFPFVIQADGFNKNNITINIDSSSQFLSALLIASVISENELTINVQGEHGYAYIDMTVAMMKQFGVDVIKGNKCFTIPGNCNYTSRDYNIEPDASGAAYMYALAPLFGLDICIPGINSSSLQGDIEFIYTLEKMGCVLTTNSDGDFILSPPTNNNLKGIDIDMSSFSDQALTLACIAPFASTPTTIRGIGHIRLQESDRLSAMATELSKMGIKVDEGPDYITIFPGIPTPATIDTYDDHRIAMSFTLIGLKTPGTVINNPECCKKTFENYFDVIDKIIQEYL